MALRKVHSPFRCHCGALPLRCDLTTPCARCWPSPRSSTREAMLSNRIDSISAFPKLGLAHCQCVLFLGSQPILEDSREGTFLVYCNKPSSNHSALVAYNLKAGHHKADTVPAFGDCTPPVWPRRRCNFAILLCPVRCSRPLKC